MYQGLGMSCIGIAPFIGIKMASYDFLMERFGPKKGSKIKPIYYNLTMGALAGTFAVTITYPTDLIRRLIQLNGTEGHNYNGLMDCLK
jgi:solute carrier family 25 phosphate transporter 23/24/25/41